jgi:hypothetical protein
VGDFGRDGQISLNVFGTLGDDVAVISWYTTEESMLYSMFATRAII